MHNIEIYAPSLKVFRGLTSNISKYFLFFSHTTNQLFFLLYFLPSNEVFTGLEFNLDALNKRAGEVETEEEESHFVLLKSPQRMLAESRAK